MKKLINDPQDVVRESLEGFALAYPDLVTVHFDPNWVGRRHDKPSPRVGLVSGGGSGHEPLHCGYVGKGMLDAAVPGPVFTSPTPDAILEAIISADHGGGVLLIVKNYTGDVLNFEVAAELAQMDGITTQTVVVTDDCGVDDSTHTIGRRGVAGALLVEKIAGAAAELGDDLEQVAAIANKVNENMRSMGLALGPCTVPHVGQPSFELGEDEIEMGIGIHGEPGYRRGPLLTADQLTEELYLRISADLNLRAGEEVIVVVNGMGGTPESELLLIFRHVAHLLARDGIGLSRSLVGDWVTSLEMPGVSLTLLRTDKEQLGLFDEPVSTPAWTKV